MFNADPAARIRDIATLNLTDEQRRAAWDYSRYSRGGHEYYAECWMAGCATCDSYLRRAIRTHPAPIDDPEPLPEAYINLEMRPADWDLPLGSDQR